MSPIQRYIIGCVACVVCLTFFLFRRPSNFDAESLVVDHVEVGRLETAIPDDVAREDPKPIIDYNDGKFHWANVTQHFPVQHLVPLPSDRYTRHIKKIQHKDWNETPEATNVRNGRRAAVQEAFKHSWKGYREHAWLKDEVGPLSGEAFDHFGGWAASLVDGLDTLWLMGMGEEFEEAVKAVSKINFSTCALDEINVFETTIRYMGGLLGAWDLTGGRYPVLLEKSVELGDMIYKAFDTPNRMPVTRWNFKDAKAGISQQAPTDSLIAEIGSLTLEMTRLSQVTGDVKYYDAIARITDQLVHQQNLTRLPGLFPIVVNPRDLNFTEGDTFTFGGMVDSLYEYLPKQYLLLDGRNKQYRQLYEKAMSPLQKHLLYRPMIPDDRDMLLVGDAIAPEPKDGKPANATTEHKTQHLSCFVGGMLALGSRAFDRPDDMELARKVVNGCVWGYETGAMGIMPEIMRTTHCPSTKEKCKWNEQAWYEAVDASEMYKPSQEELSRGSALNVDDKIRQYHLPQGVTSIEDTRYGLRPEAIESLFILYRLTGDSKLADQAWDMFQAIMAATQTPIGAAALEDCTDPDAKRADRMESYWFAETLKYFFLIFADHWVVDLDEWVLNTEAHAFRWRGG